MEKITNRKWPNCDPGIHPLCLSHDGEAALPPDCTVGRSWWPWLWISSIGSSFQFHFPPSHSVRIVGFSPVMKWAEGRLRFFPCLNHPSFFFNISFTLLTNHAIQPLDSYPFRLSGSSEDHITTIQIASFRNSQSIMLAIFCLCPILRYQIKQTHQRWAVHANMILERISKLDLKNSSNERFQQGHYKTSNAYITYPCVALLRAELDDTRGRPRFARPCD